MVFAKNKNMENKNIDNKEVIKFYDDYVARQKKVGVNERHKKILYYLKKFGLNKHDKVLEIGCGIGTVSNLVSNHLSSDGHLKALDISKKSIEEAKQIWRKHDNIDFIAADITEHSFKTKFNVIFFPDVLEHIPAEKHEAIFLKSAELLNDDGFILIHIPDPIYLDHVRNNNPNELQVIDQSLYLNHFVSSIEKSQLYITYLNSYSIWNNPLEYQVIILKKIKRLQKIEQIEHKIKLKDKIIHKIKSVKK